VAQYPIGIWLRLTLESTPHPLILLQLAAAGMVAALILEPEPVPVPEQVVEMAMVGLVVGAGLEMVEIDPKLN
jgi:hypothetical protein